MIGTLRCRGEGYLEWIFPGAEAVRVESSCNASLLQMNIGFSDLLREQLKTGEVNLLRADRVEFSETTPAAFTSLNDRWGVSASRSSLGYEYFTTPDQNSEFKSEILEGGVHYELDSPALRGRLFMGAGLRGVNQSQWRLGFTVKPWDCLRLGFTHRSSPNYYRLHYNYRGEPVDVPFAFNASSDIYTAKLSLGQGISFKSACKYTWLGKDYTQGADFRLNPWVRLFRFQVMFSFPVSRACELGLGWSRFSLDGGARLLHYAVSYGKFTTVEADFRGPAARAELTLPSTRKLTLEWEWVEAGGKLRGHVELWPFTPALVDLLGYRRYFKGEGELKGQRLSVSTDFRLFKNLQFHPAAHFVDLFTEGEFSSWQPEWLVFGKTDERISTLRIRRIQALLCRIGFIIPWESAEFGYYFQQWIPIRVDKRSAESVAQEPSHPDLEAANSTGGRTHRFTLKVNLGITGIQ